MLRFMMKNGPNIKNEWVIHGHTPRQMVPTRERAELLSTEPLCRSTGTNSWSNAKPIGVVGADNRLRVFRKDEPKKQHCPSEQAHPQDDVILHQELGIATERGVDHVREVGLVADVDESKQGEELVHGMVTVVDPEVLEPL